MSPLLPVCLIAFAGISAGGGWLFYYLNVRWAGPISWATALLFLIGATQALKQLMN